MVPYTANTAPGSFVAVSPGQLTLWAIGVNTPVFKLIYGKQEFNWGFGLQFAASRTEEYVIAEQSTPVPSILASLIGVGLLPATALSWF